MDIILLIKSAIVLTVILFILIYFLFKKPTKKKKKSKKINKQKSKKPIDLKSLSAIIKNPNTDTNTLEETLNKILKYHGNIPAKIGTNNHPNFIMYEDIVFAICRHPNTKSKLITKFTSELEKRNESYKGQINDALTRGLNSRAFLN